MSSTGWLPTDESIGIIVLIELNKKYALEQASKGIAVRPVVPAGPYRTALNPIIAELGQLRVMTPAERELRSDLQPLIESGGVEVVQHEGWLTTSSDFENSAKKAPRGEWIRFTVNSVDYVCYFTGPRFPHDPKTKS